MNPTLHPLTLLSRRSTQRNGFSRKTHPPSQQYRYTFRFRYLYRYALGGTMPSPVTWPYHPLSSTPSRRGGGEESCLADELFRVWGEGRAEVSRSWGQAARAGPARAGPVILYRARAARDASSVGGPWRPGPCRPARRNGDLLAPRRKQVFVYIHTSLTRRAAGRTHRAYL